MEIFKSAKLNSVFKIVIVFLSILLPITLIGDDVGAIVALILPILIVFFLPYRHRWENIKEIGLYKPKRIGSLIIQAVIVGLLLSFFFKTVLTPLLETILNSKRDLTSFYEIKGNTKLLLVYIIRLILIAGFFEEIIFRGFLISKFLILFNKSNFGWFVSIVLAATIFAFFHAYQGLVGIIYTAIAGLVLGYLYKYYNKNLWYLIIIHSSFDISSAFLIYFDYYDEVTSLFF